jgi:hypothetical protein
VEGSLDVVACLGEGNVMHGSIRPLRPHHYMGKAACTSTMWCCCVYRVVLSLSVLAFIGPFALLELRCVAIVFSRLFSMSSVSAPINLHARRLLLVLIAVTSLVADVPQVCFLYSSDVVLRFHFVRLTRTTKYWIGLGVGVGGGGGRVHKLHKGIVSQEFRLGRGGMGRCFFSCS